MISGLYLVTDHNRDGRLVERVAAALRGGVRIVQYREKHADAATRFSEAAALRELCRRHGVLFFVNDDADLAVAVDADGLHIGQEDGSIRAARQAIGARRLLGVSANTVALAQQAIREGADHLGVGAIYPTGSKSNAELVGLDRLIEIRAAVKAPIVAIGGLCRDNCGAVLDAGADALAVISAVMDDAAPQIAARELSLLFNRSLPMPQGRVLSIAGSDSGGGAGIQADLKTITLLGAYGMSAITALTAQNTRGVSAIEPASPEFVAAQIEAVLTDIGSDTAKTGMLFSAAIIRVVAAALREQNLLTVVDPVMIAKGGASLLQPEAVAALRDDLLPAAYLVTPNLPEAEALTGLSIHDEADMQAAGRALQEIGCRNVLIKGGHLAGSEAIDLLFCGTNVYRFSVDRVDTVNTHGTGCTFSAAIATYLARGEALPQAVAKAKTFLTAAIRSAVPLGSGHGPVNHWQGAKTLSAP